MAAADDTQLLQLAKQILLIMQKSSGANSAGGGSSSGLSLGTKFENATKKLDKAQKEYADTVKTSKGVVGELSESMKRVTKYSKVFGDSIGKATDDIVKASNRNADATRQMAEATLKEAKAKGINNKEMHDAAKISLAYAASLEKIMALNNKLTAIKKAEKQLADERVNRDRLKALVQDDATKKLVKASKEKIKSLEEITAQEISTKQELKETKKEFKELTKKFAAGGVVFDSLNDTMKEAVRTGKVANKSNRDGLKTYEKVRDSALDHGDALSGYAKAAGEHSKAFKTGLDAVVRGFGHAVRALAGGFDKMVDNTLSQVKNNIRGSMDLAATAMGMSSGDLYNTLGANSAEARMLGGSYDPSNVVKSGKLSTLQEAAHRFGLKGKDAAGRGLEYASMQRGMGIKTNETVAANSINRMNSNAYGAAGSGEELYQLQKSLLESGDMLLVTEKYRMLGAEAASAAIDKEMRMRLVNSVVLGKNTKQLEADMRAAQDGKYSSITEGILGKIAGQKAVADMRASGTKVSAADEESITWAFMQKDAQAGGNQNAAKLIQDYTAGNGDKMDAAWRKRDHAGIINSRIGLDIMGKMDGGFTSSKDAIKTAQNARNRAGAQNPFAASGNALAEAPGSLDDFNTALGKAAATLIQFSQYKDGVQQNPAAGAVKSLAGTAMTAAQTIFMWKMLKGLGGGGGAPGPRPPGGGPRLGGLSPRMLAGGVGSLVGGVALNAGADHFGRDTKTGAGMDIASYALSGAGMLGMGAGLASGGVLAVPGAVLGGILGAGYGTYKNWGTLTGDGEPKSDPTVVPVVAFKPEIEAALLGTAVNTGQTASAAATQATTAQTAHQFARTQAQIEATVGAARDQAHANGVRMQEWAV